MWDLKKYKDNTAVIDDEGVCLTYSGLEDETERLADHIGQRCLIFILCENVIGSLLGYVACLNNRFVPVMLSASLEKNMLEDLIDLYSPKYIWAPDNMREEFPEHGCVYSSYGYSLLNTKSDMLFKLNED